MRRTHTYVELEISAPAWREIHEKLAAAGYQHAFMDDRTIDMHGIAVVPASGEEGGEDDGPEANLP